MMNESTPVVLGIDVGTGSTKGVLVTETGRICASATREHEVSRPRSGHVEMAAEVWWEELRSITAELLTAAGDTHVQAIGLSGMGPCVLLADQHGTPIRPAILYGVDTRAGEQIDRITTEIGEEEILARCGSVLTSQAAGPKIAWVRDTEPGIYERAQQFLMPASFLAQRLTGEYVLDHHSASQSTPLYDTEKLDWHDPWWQQVAQGIEKPRLTWPGDVAGVVTERAASEIPGITPGTPVITGTIDAWNEAISVDAQNPGDLMLMYGTTLFLIATASRRSTSRTMWGTVGAFPGTYNLAGGMATSGAITTWLRDIVGGIDYSRLLAEAENSGPGAGGLLMLPYFAGERTPIQDPDARGILIGLTLDHTRGDLYRAALEATALGVRHNVEQFNAAGIGIDRVVAAGGGTQGGLWPRIVTDVTGLEQAVPTVHIGASYGAAALAARHAPDIGGGSPIDVAAWNPPREVLTPDQHVRSLYDDLYGHYLELYERTKETAHHLAAFQRRR